MIPLENAIKPEESGIYFLKIPTVPKISIEATSDKSALFFKRKIPLSEIYKNIIADWNSFHKLLVRFCP